MRKLLKLKKSKILPQTNAINSCQLVRNYLGIKKKNTEKMIIQEKNNNTDSKKKKKKLFKEISSYTKGKKRIG